MASGTTSPPQHFPAMTIFHALIVAFWLLFLVYWGIAAINAKPTLNKSEWWKQAALRACIVALLIVAYQVPALRHAFKAAQTHMGDGIVSGAIGTILVGCGIGLAILARVYLGRNWGTPMSQKENPELVTGGPYALIRHPIYSGIMLAMFGSMIGTTLFWLLPLILLGAYFIYSARREEELMCRQFPGQYPAYMARTNMLVPFLL